MKKSRKKILLSSIAMLLVALVALGSATFAWFTINKAVTADAMNVTAATTSGLQITNTNGGTWARDVHYTLEGAVLNPTSRGFTDSAFQSAGYLPADVSTEGSGARAWDSTAGATNHTTNWAEDAGRPTVSTTSGTIAQAANGNYAEFRVGVRSSGNTAISDVKLDVNFTPDATNGHNADQYIRIVVLEEGQTAPVAYIANGGADTNAVTAINTTTALPTTVARQVDTSASAVNIGNVTNTARNFRIIVWFEGQDAQCVDANQAATGNIDVKFYFD